MDDATDRGMVWIYPGSPATLHLVVDRNFARGSIAEILKEAEEAVEKQFLSYLR